MSSVAEILLAAKNLSGLSVEAIAAKARVSKTTVQDAIQGKTKPHGSTLFAFARGFGFTTWEEVIDYAAPALRGDLQPQPFITAEAIEAAVHALAPDFARMILQKMANPPAGAPGEAEADQDADDLGDPQAGQRNGADKRHRSA